MLVEILLIALWGAVVLAAMDGWGGLAARLAPAIQPDIGLRMAWGMAVLLALGGMLTALSLATRPIVPIVVAGGALLALPLWWREFRPTWVGWIGCAAGVILGLHYLTQVAGVQAVCPDDNVAYFGFVKRQLELGAADEQFSLRRLAGHGGQMFLQSLIVARGGLENAFLIERGIAPIVIYLLLRGALPGRAPILPALILAMTMITMTYEFNSQSVCTGIVLFLGLARTLVAMDAPIRSRAGELLLLTLIVAGAASLRAHFLVGGTLTVAAWLLSGFRGTATIPGLSWRAAILFFGSLFFFAPWMAGLWRSSGTPLFPLISGTGANGYDTFSASGAAFYDLALDYLTSADGLFLCLPLLALWRPGPERRVLVISYGVAVLVTMLFSVHFSGSDSWDLGRYMWPMVLVPVLLSLIMVLRGTLPSDPRSRAFTSFLVGCFAIAGARLGYATWQMTLALDPAKSAEEARLTELYRRLQDLVPVNETLLVATDNPYLVDYRRNKTFNVDLPGAASPAPGMPLFHGPEAVQDYLLAKGVHYVLFTDGWEITPCLFDRARYANPKMPEKLEILRLQARYNLEFLNNMDSLAARDPILGRLGHYTLMRLSGHGAGTPSGSATLSELVK